MLIHGGDLSGNLVQRLLLMGEDFCCRLVPLSKSDSHIARASLILILEILEMVCNGLQTNWRDRIGLTSTCSGQLESLWFGL